MKIRLLMLSDDEAYTQRISIAFLKYSSSLELYAFNNLEDAYNCVTDTEIDVFVSERKFSVDIEKLSPYCAFVYFSDDASVTKINDVYAIGKFQSVDSTYKRIVDLYTDVSGKTIEKRNNASDGTCKKILFTSFSGGVGVSSMSVSASIEAARIGRKVLYLSLESIPSTNSFFKADGNQNFSKVIYALKSDPNKNIQLKLESLVSKSEDGVCYYNEPETALDMSELSWSDVDNLINQIAASELYDVLIIDKQFENEYKCLEFINTFNNIVVVCDGSAVSNSKSKVGIEAIKLFEQDNAYDILSKMVIAYNKYSNKTSCEMTAGNLNDLEGVPRFEHAGTNEVVNHIVERRLFSALF